MPHDAYLSRKAFDNALRHLLHVVTNGTGASVEIRADVTYTFDSDIGTGKLSVGGADIERVSARRYLWPWLHVRFDDPARAYDQPTGPTVNPYSGKWNHHPYSAAQTHAIESHLSGINMRITGSDADGP